jgi:hypothetical protein
MRFFWRSDEIHSHAEWRRRIASNDDQPFRSAPTLATAWTGPLELLSALSKQEGLIDFVIEKVIIEAQTRFDQFGGPRNHDLLVKGRAKGETVVVAVEAKAGETFGPMVSEYRAAGARKRGSGEATNAPERLEQLLGDFGLDRAGPAEADGLRYQLLAALAGTLAAAQEAEAEHAVLMVHDFITDERLPHADDLRNFARLICSADLPGSQDPWCIEVDLATRNGSGFDGRVYLAHATSDLRSPRPQVVDG